MSADPHWDNLKEIFLAAVALAPDERRTYLDRACDGDTSLQVAVESLLKSHEKSGFIDEPAYRAAAEMLNALEFESGQTVAITDSLAAGRRRNGQVILRGIRSCRSNWKFLRSAGIHMRRFVGSESAAGLHHPNIAQIFEIGITDHTSIAMGYEVVKSASLSRRKLEIKKAVGAAQVASGSPPHTRELFIATLSRRTWL
jgi:hypothetical protein